MAKVVMLVNSFFKGAKSGQPMQLAKGQFVDESEVTHLVKGQDYAAKASVEAKADEQKKTG
jgi:hypothetical protein